MKGFHTLELVMVLAITSMVILLGISGLESFLTKNALEQGYALFHDLHYARQAAIHQNTPVYICVSNDLQTCSLEKASGYILYTLKNTKKEIMASNYFPKLLLLLKAGFGNEVIYFSPTGLCNVSSSFYVTSNKSSQSMRIVILASGRIRLEKNLMA
ncbi:MAG TPA: GspH/FimT family pseudopilin [Gammaproteobacteria bacterium]|nr:GspH/FimT family pseudopilin [Gammaproteobacteria bacterium]